MTAVLIDDEEESRNVLQHLLSLYCPDVSILELCPNGYSGLEAIKKHNPDLIFMDVEMPDISGLDIVKTLGEISSQVIFSTAHNHYSLPAIKLSALDFLLKPVSPVELIQAVSKAKKKKQEHITLKQYEILLQLTQQLDKTIAIPKKIAIQSQDSIDFINPDHIIRIEANQSYCTLVLTENRKILTSGNIGEFEDMLTPFPFLMRVHRSHIVNLNQVSKMNKGDKTSFLMSDNQQVDVSRQHREEALKRLKDL